MKWEKVNSGTTIGCRGSEQGVILRDELLPNIGRITLEKDGQIAPFAITCGVFGEFVHTVFSDTLVDVNQKYDAIKIEIERFPTNKNQEDWIEQFTEKFN